MLSTFTVSEMCKIIQAALYHFDPLEPNITPTANNPSIYDTSKKKCKDVKKSKRFKVQRDALSMVLI